MERSLRALVVAGGTREPIDDVRFVSNFSRGGFGAQIAEQLQEAGCEVTLLAGVELRRQPGWIADGIELHGFGSFAELRQELDRLLEAQSFDLLFMAAAISDYSPVPTEGKIRSSDEELVLRLRRNPKLLASLREKAGRACFVVGFKLLSGVEPGELIEVAHAQVKKTRINLCIANDLQQIDADDHRVHLVTPEGGAIALRGPRAQITPELVRFVLRRRDVIWSRSLRAEQLAEPDAGLEAAARLLQAAQAANLLPGTDGNVSHRATQTDGFWVSPRQLPKDAIEAEDLLRVEVDLRARQVHYHLQRAELTHKSSIDSSVQGWLYDRMPWLQAMLHFHRAMVLPTARTHFPYPCGCREEAVEIYGALARAASQGRWDGASSFAVQMVDHGFLLGFARGQVDRFASQWEEIHDIWRGHMEEIGRADQGKMARLLPILEGVEIRGLLADYQGAISVFLHPEQRSSGLGERVIEALNGAGENIVAGDRCEVREYYQQRGWRLLSHQGGLAVLQPPSVREDLREAASISLYHPPSQQVLLGRRLTPPWEGYWAFPGGSIEEGESRIEAGLRELEEETGIEAVALEPLLRTTVHVGVVDSARAYSVHNTTLPCLQRRAPQRSEELEGRWVSLQEALDLRPMASGTRRVLRRLDALLRGPGLPLQGVMDA